MVLLASLTLVVGYYLGQAWQRQPLNALSAVVYPDGKAVAYPADFAIGSDDTNAPWRLVMAVDTRAADCEDLLRHLVLVHNRLAGWPRIQQRFRPTLMAYDQPDQTHAESFLAGSDWVDLVSASAARMDSFAAELGISPDQGTICTPAGTNGVLIAPGGQRWALVPYEQAAIMAHNIATIIQFVE